MTLRTVGVRLTADVNAYVANMKKAGASTKDFVGETDKAAKSGHLDAVADRAGIAGIALVGMAGYAIKSAADFEKSMSKVKAATHASSGEIDQLRKAALQAGKDTQYSATGAADAITELSKAGVSTADVLNGGLKGALSLAAAGQLDVGEAAETAASALTQFKLKGKDIPHVADLLAAAAGKAQGSVHDMGYALNQSGLVAAQFGLSIEDTTGVLAEFANAGLTGSDAGTSFKTMLLAMANPSDITRGKMDELGISFYDAQGQFIGLAGVAQELQSKLKGVSQETRQSALAQIFGNDAVRAASILYSDGAAGVQKWKSAVDDSGYAAQTAADLTDNLAGDLERLKGSLETLAIESGGGANGGLRVLVQGLESLVDEFEKLPKGISGAMVVLAGVGGVVALALAAFIKLRVGLATAVEQLNAMGPAGARAAAGLSAVASVAGKVAGIFAALEVIGAIADHFGAASINVDKLTASLIKFSDTGQVTGEMSKAFGDDLGDLGKNAATAEAATHGFWKGLNDLTSGIWGVNSVVDTLNEKIYGLSFNQAKDNMAQLDAALTQFMTTTGDARKSSELWNKVVQESGIPIDHLIELLPSAYKKVGELNTAAMKGAGGMRDLAGGSATAADATKKYETAAELAAGAAKGEADAVTQLSKILKAEADPVFGLIAAQNTLSEAQKKAAEATRKHGANSKEAKQATGELAMAAIDLQSKVGALGNSFDGKLTPSMKATLKAAGLTDGQIRTVEKSFKDAKKAAEAFDGKYAANVSITGDKPVGQKLNRLAEIQQALKSGKSVAVMNAAEKKGFGYQVGGRTAMAAEDEPVGVVHGKEFVVNAPTVRRIDQQAPGFLDEMHATGQLPGFEAGGRVGWPYPVTAAQTRIPSQAEVMKAVTPEFGHWPGSPGAQRGDSGVWRKILTLVKASGIPYDFGNSYRPGDPLWHGSGRAIDFMGYNQDRLAQFFMARQNQVLELIHRTKNRDYGITRGHYNAMPTQWPLHRNHLHIAMKNGGTINEPIFGVGASGRTYSMGENYQSERVIPNWQGGGGGGGGGVTNVTVNVTAPVGTHPREIGRQVVAAIGSYVEAGGELRLANGTKVL